MTLVDLATKAGLLLKAVAAVENGSDSDPRISVVAAIARALGTSLNAVTGGASEIPPPLKKLRK